MVAVPRLEQHSFQEPRLQGQMNNGWSRLSENVRPNYCQRNLSEVGVGVCGERQELKLFFQEKQKVVQGRKLIIVHYVLYLRTVFT